MSVEVRQFNCPQCGAPLDIKNLGRSKSIICAACNSQIDLTRPPYQVIGNVGQRPVPIGAPFQLGMQGAIGPETYAIIGRVRYRDQDDEWDEWLVLSTGGAYRWISDSADVGMVFWKPVTPPAPIDPSIIERGGVFNLGYGPAQVRSRGDAVIAYQEGELTWRARLGDRMDYAEAVSGNTLYSIEWTPNEIEFFQGERVDRGTVEAAFGLPPRGRVPGVAAGAVGRPPGRPPRTLWGCAFLPTAALVLIVAVILMCIVFAVVAPAVSSVASGVGGSAYTTTGNGSFSSSSSGSSSSSHSSSGSSSSSHSGSSGSIRSGSSGSRSTSSGSHSGGGK